MFKKCSKFHWCILQGFNFTVYELLDCFDHKTCDHRGLVFSNTSTPFHIFHVSIIEKSINSVYFMVETWFLHDQCTLNIKFISEVKGQTWWNHLRFISNLTSVNIFKTLFFPKTPRAIFIIFLYIDNKVTTIMIIFCTFSL